MLKATGLAFAGSALTAGTAAAHGNGTAGSGTEIAVGNGLARAYTERAHGRLSAVGVEFGAAALEGLPSDLPGTVYHLELPRGDTGRFEYVGLDWNPMGHPPLGLYGHEHFDVHFHLLPEEDVASIPGGTATYDIPDALMPANTYTTADLPPGMAAPREVVPGMGEHLASVPASLPASPGSDGWSVFIWGAYDPDGDGTGQATFMEPMITKVFLEGLRGDGSADAEAITAIPMPERFLKAGRYPTESVVRYHTHDDAFTVSLESFEQFRGYGRR